MINIATSIAEYLGKTLATHGPMLHLENVIWNCRYKRDSDHLLCGQMSPNRQEKQTSKMRKTSQVNQQKLQKPTFVMTWWGCICACGTDDLRMCEGNADAKMCFGEMFAIEAMFYSKRPVIVLAGTVPDFILHFNISPLCFYGTKSFHRDAHHAHGVFLQHQNSRPLECWNICLNHFECQNP